MTGTSGAAPRYTELRRAVLQLALGILVLDAIAITAYVGLDVAERSRNDQYVFIGVWLALTVGVVLRGLSRVKNARIRARRSSG